MVKLVRVTLKDRTLTKKAPLHTITGSAGTMWIRLPLRLRPHLRKKKVGCRVGWVSVLKKIGKRKLNGS